MVDFLDVRLFRTPKGVGTTLFRKHTDRNTVLHAQSFHPPAVLKSIPYTQFLRVFRVNTNGATAKTQALEMRDRFLTRGYEWDFLNGELERACKNAGAGQVGEVTNVKRDDKMVFVTNFMPVSKQVNSVMRKHWPILQLDTNLPFTDMSPPICAYRRGRSLKNILMETDLRKEKSETWLKAGKLGCYRCGGCKTCGCLLTGGTFPHPHTDDISVGGTVGCTVFIWGRKKSRLAPRLTEGLSAGTGNNLSLDGSCQRWSTCALNMLLLQRYCCTIHSSHQLLHD
ncbi:uncharacterized protein LOC121393207 [Xenopus laevis]|uniref:Uncharacterized protein LOC121393207 n=1 Tax=Xenopus laevis TaxID=8355 RepID=A0A8J1KI46_XENLA|nr:uncharacterized protein LOC121393207 [Xenopus laevis]XP_041417031.1 uncharacterized protein LOC121393207 [Xenopus laevis]